MLKGISPVLGAEALWVLAAMGHGDDLALVDRNFPAAEVASRTVTGRLVRLDGVDATAAARQAFAVIQTTESRPYGCFLIRKGVVFD